MSAHTPGPWMYDRHPHSGWGMVRAADGMPVAQTSMSARYSPDDIGKAAPEEIAANAHLIAAAPDLLAIANDVAAFLRTVCWFDHTSEATATDLCVRLDAAIAKAEGPA